MSAFSLHLKPVSSSGAAYANVPVQNTQHMGWLRIDAPQAPRHDTQAVSTHGNLRLGCKRTC